MTESILCVPSIFLDRLGLAEGFTPMQREVLGEAFPPDVLWLGPRPTLETNEGFRQFVSYLVVQHGDQTLIYRRSPKGGEQRLHGRISIGVGGHVNLSDVVQGASGLDLLATVEKACAREWVEEVHAPTLPRFEVIGLLKEEVNAVARVHLGIVVRVQVESAAIEVLDPGLVDVCFVPREELPALTDVMESWSAALVPFLCRA